MIRFTKLIEQVVVYTLISLMSLVVVLATAELAWLIYRDLATPPILILEIDQLLELFGFFLLILIGVELLETIKAYLAEHVVHVEIVVEVALIAIARKVIILDLDKYSGPTVVGIAALILALSVAYYIEKRARRADARADRMEAAADPAARRA